MKNHLTPIALAIASLPAFAIEDVPMPLPTVTVTGQRQQSPGGTFVPVPGLVPAGSSIKYGSVDIDKYPSQPLSWEPRKGVTPTSPGTPMQVIGGVAAVGGLTLAAPLGPAVAAAGVVAGAIGTIQNSVPQAPASGTFSPVANLAPTGGPKGQRGGQ